MAMPRLAQTRPFKLDVSERLSVASRVLLAYMLMCGCASAQTTPAPTVAANQLPTGAQVSAGQASVSQSGNTLNVNQTSQRAVVDWTSFNVGKDATVNFQQPNAQSATLNRVNDTQPSQILGRITAPGQVVLVNPEGVYFGKTATVDVGVLYYYYPGGNTGTLETDAQKATLFKAVRDFRTDKETSFRSFAELCVTRQITVVRL